MLIVRSWLYKRNGELFTMIESVVALLMFVNAEIKEARLQTEGMARVPYVVKDTQNVTVLVNLLHTNVGKVQSRIRG